MREEVTSPRRGIEGEGYGPAKDDEELRKQNRLNNFRNRSAGRATTERIIVITLI